MVPGSFLSPSKTSGLQESQVQPPVPGVLQYCLLHFHLNCKEESICDGALGQPPSSSR